MFADDRYWAVTVDYAKADPTDLCMRISVENRGPDAATLHVLPTLWFRNTWAWGLPGQDAVPRICADGAATLVAEHTELGGLVLTGEPGGVPLLCDNETNTERLWGVPGRSRYPKDGINDHVVHGAATVNPERVGTKGALWYRLEVPAGGTSVLRLRLSAGTTVPGDAALGSAFDDVMTARRTEADGYYAALPPTGTTAEEALVLRQALAGMLWGKQFFHYDVARWLDGDPAGPPPPASRRQRPQRRLAAPEQRRRHLDARPVGVPLVRGMGPGLPLRAARPRRPAFAKDQLVLLLREWYMHPNGQIPAYEWAFGDVNPPVHAWAALRVFEIDGAPRLRLPGPGLPQAADQLHVVGQPQGQRRATTSSRAASSAWTTSARSTARPRCRWPALLEQSDGTAWMAMYCLNLLEMALVLARHDPAYEDVATKFFEHFALHRDRRLRGMGLWDEDDGFFYDVLSTADGQPDADAGALDGRAPAAVRHHHPGHRDPASACRASPSATGGSSTNRPEARGGRRPDPRARRRRRHGCCRWSGPPSWSGSSPRCSTRRSSCPRTGCGRCPRRHATEPFVLDAARDARRRRLRARRVDDRPVRRQLELARSGVVPGQLS